MRTAIENCVERIIAYLNMIDKGKNNILMRWLRLKRRIMTFLLILISVVVIVAVAYIIFSVKDSNIEVTDSTTVEITPSQIESIRAIGEWEFLTVNDEELVDTIDKGFFRDKELIRIYYGTLRFGIDLRRTAPQWIEVKDSVVNVLLPKIILLDRDFIDETRTKPFFESGTWTSTDREMLYKKAYRQMYDRCYTLSNIRTAEDNAKRGFTRLLNSMGFKNVVVSFEQQ